MKHFIEVFFIAMALVLAVFGKTDLAIFAGMFAVIGWMLPKNATGKSVEQIIEEAEGNLCNTILVEYQFNSNKDEKFTAHLARIGTGSLKKDEVQKSLMNYIETHTGSAVDPKRVHIISYKEEMFRI